MENQKKKLALKTAAVFGAAIAALTGVNNSDTSSKTFEDFNAKTVEFSQNGGIKPMPVLKMNFDNPDESKFVAQHRSHYSHSSHRSHYSHYSHRSMTM